MSEKIDQAKQNQVKQQAAALNEEQADLHKSPQELRSELTNKNEDYVFRLTKELKKQGGLSQADAEQKVNALLGEIVAAQHKGLTASALFKMAPSLKANEILHPVQKPTKTPAWQAAVDNILLYFAIFAGFIGLVAMFSTKKTTNNQMGILSIIVISVMFGILMAKYNDMIVNAQGNVSWGKLIAVSLGLALVMVVVMTVLTVKPLIYINPILPGWILVVFAGIAIAGRYGFRKYYHITGSALAPSPQHKTREN